MERQHRKADSESAPGSSPELASGDWQLDEIRAALAQLDAGQWVGHEEVAHWLRSWGKTDEGSAPS